MVKKIGEMLPVRRDWNDNYKFPMFDSGDPANPDPQGSFFQLRTGAATLTNKTLGAGTTFSVAPTASINAGTVPGGTVVATEYGDGTRFRTSLALTAFDAGDSGDNAAKAIGALLYTLPAGVIMIEAAHIAVATTIADAVQTDTPEIGIGNVVASGVVSVLGGTPGFENVYIGTAIADVAGTTHTGTKLPTAAVPLILAAGDPHTLYLNYADTWANLTAESELAVTGTIVLLWRFLI